MLLVVADQIVEAEAVVRDDEVDAGVRLRPSFWYRSLLPGQAITEIRKLAFVALPVAADSVAIFAVPLRPQHREIANLISAAAHIPWLSDELYLRDDRILMNDVEERRQPIDIVQFACEGRRQIEAETVNVHLRDPVAQAIHDELQHLRMAHIQAIARARVVHVIARLVWHQPVVRGIVDAAKTAWAPGDCLRRCGYTPRRESPRYRRGAAPDHRLELCHLRARRACRAIVRHPGEVVQRVVSPVIGKPLVHENLVVHELMDRHQLHRSDAQPLEVFECRRAGQGGVGAAQLLGNMRIQLAEALARAFRR